MVSSFDLAMSRVIFGTSDGRISICEFDGTEMDVTTPPPVCEWAGHHQSVEAVFHVQRGVRGENTSIFLHLCGRVCQSTTHDFVLSIGCGSGYPDLTGLFPNSVQGKDYALNAWMFEKVLFLFHL